MSVQSIDEFDECKDRLDILFRDNINQGKHPELFKITQQLLLLSHGNGSVESGYSNNKLMMDDNQDMVTLIALRRCRDGLEQVAKNVLAAVRGVRGVDVKKI